MFAKIYINITALDTVIYDIKSTYLARCSIPILLCFTVNLRDCNGLNEN